MRWPSFSAFLIGALALAAPIAAAPGDDGATKKADAELQKLIDEAIEKGSHWLAKQQARDGSFPSAYDHAYPMGSTALCTLALLHSGIPRDDIGIVQAFRHLRRVYPIVGGRSGPRPQGLRTYSVALTIMALARYGRAGTAPGEDGTFFLPPRDMDWMREMTEWLVRHQAPGGGWRYPEGGSDNSNSQYALLALKEAKSVGIPVPRETFERALRHFLGDQERDGPRVERVEESGGDGVYGATRSRARGYDRARGWGYVKGSAATGSMTTAGVAALAIAKDEVRDAKLVAQAEQGMRDGIAWLSQNFSVEASPGGGWHFYYLYGLERAGVLSRVVYMGDHRWYAEGARFLVKARSRVGGWSVSGGGRAALAQTSAGIDTSFALLFLTRATAHSFTVPTPPELLNLTEGEKLADRDLADLFKAAFGELDRLDDDGRKKRARDFAFLGPRVIGLLLPGLSATDVETRRRSIEIIRIVTGYGIGFDPEGSEDEREEAAGRWTEWYLSHRERLKLDREARLIR